MAEETKDLNTSQSVADPDLNKAPVVTEPDLTATGQGEPVKLADGTDENKTVPYTEMKKAIDAKNEAEELLQKQQQEHQTQMAILQANQQPAQQAQTQPLNDYDQAKANLRLTDEEYLDESQRSNVQTEMTKLQNVRHQQSVISLTNQQFEISHSDFGNVVGLRNPTGQIQPTAEMLKILTEKPYLSAAAIASSQGAYEIVMNERRLQELTQQNTVQEEHLKQQGIETKLAPVSGAAAAGGAVSSKATGTITTEQQVENERKVAAGELK